MTNISELKQIFARCEDGGFWFAVVESNSSGLVSDLAASHYRDAPAGEFVHVEITGQHCTATALAMSKKRMNARQYAKVLARHGSWYTEEQLRAADVLVCVSPESARKLLRDPGAQTRSASARWN